MKNFILELMFKLKMHTAHGMLFQDLFDKLLKRLDPSAHIIQQYGGDGGCDGYSPGLDIHFALTTQKQDLKNKIQDDFKKYLKAPKSDNFVFVYPRNDMRREMSDTIQTLQSNNSGIIIKLWDYFTLIELFNSLDDRGKSVVLETPPINNNSISDEDAIVPIILEILKKCNGTPITSLDTFTEGNLPELINKLLYNATNKLMTPLNDASNLTAAKIFFEENPGQQDIIRKFIIQQYAEVKKINDIDADTIVFMVMTRCYPNITEGNFISLLSIMAHVIELCDLLEEPSTGWAPK